MVGVVSCVAAVVTATIAASHYFLILDRIESISCGDSSGSAGQRPSARELAVAAMSTLHVVCLDSRPERLSQTLFVADGTSRRLLRIRSLFFAIPCGGGSRHRSLYGR